MSKYFETFKKYYKMKIYKKEHLKLFVEKGQLTPEEYELIVGEPYEP